MIHMYIDSAYPLFTLQHSPFFSRLCDGIKWIMQRQSHKWAGLEILSEHSRSDKTCCPLLQSDYQELPSHISLTMTLSRTAVTLPHLCLPWSPHLWGFNTSRLRRLLNPCTIPWLKIHTTDSESSFSRHRMFLFGAGYLDLQFKIF